MAKERTSELEDINISIETVQAFRRGESGNSDRFYFVGSKITADSDCSHEIERHLLLGRKARTNLDSILKKQRHHRFANKGLFSQSYGFPSSHVWM